MQLILDTENPSVNINEKMSTLTSETVLETSLPNGDTKEIVDTFNGKPESNGTSNKENVENKDNNLSKSDELETLDEAGDFASVEKSKEALKQIQQCVPTEVTALALENGNEKLLDDDKPLDGKEITQEGEKENFNFDSEKSASAEEKKESASYDEEIQLNETKEQEFDEAEKQELCKTDNSGLVETENIEQENTLKLKLDVSEQIKVDETQKSKLDTTKNEEPEETKHLKLVDVDETGKFEHEDLNKSIAKTLNSDETEGLELEKMDDTEHDKLKNLELNKTQGPIEQNPENGKLIHTEIKEREENSIQKTKDTEKAELDVAENPPMNESIPSETNLSDELLTHIPQESGNNTTAKSDNIGEKIDDMEVDEEDGFTIDQELEDSSEKNINQSISNMVDNIVQNLNEDTAEDSMDGMEIDNNENVDQKMDCAENVQKINNENVDHELKAQDNISQKSNELITENILDNLKSQGSTEITQEDKSKENDTSTLTQTMTNLAENENRMEVDEELDLKSVPVVAKGIKAVDNTHISQQKNTSNEDIIENIKSPQKIIECAENTEKSIEPDKESLTEIIDELKTTTNSDIKLDASVKENVLLLNSDKIAEDVAVSSSIVEELEKHTEEAATSDNNSEILEVNSSDSLVKNLEGPSTPKGDDEQTAATDNNSEVIEVKSSDSLVKNLEDPSSPIGEDKETAATVNNSEVIEVESSDSLVKSFEDSVPSFSKGDDDICCTSGEVKKATDNSNKDVSDISDKENKTSNADLSETKDDTSDVEEVKLVDESKNDSEKARNEKTPERVAPLIKLSNTMDILSDEEEEAPAVKLPEKVTERSEKQCINLDDDDDIMLIDDDTNKEEKKEFQNTEHAIEKVKESEVISTETNVEDPKDAENKIPEVQSEPEKDLAKPEVPVKEILSPQPEVEKPLETESEKPEKSRSLIPGDLFKSYRKNLTDMTRDDLEEFCILKIVESIIDRSNLNEIRSKLKSMGQTIEEYKKKALMLTKQNRDLQVVLKSVQEEQKKSNGTQPITPLKITRSVGMQVLMTDKNRRRMAVPNLPNAVNNVIQANTNRTMRNTTPSPRNTPQKPVNNHTNIPVPRLVPAGPNINNKAVTPGTPVIVKPAAAQNGVKNVSPAQKPEKRTHSRMQSQSSSVTVDLTDDEPPSKIQTKSSPAPPVRLVNQQNLIAPRQQFTQQVNSPRKVYIPISINGPQAQNVRPGQTIMLKTVSAQGPRPRGPAPSTMVRAPQSAVQVRRLAGQRHPAPLPDAMKQYQPPNWKALPPAPDLKLSKVENGIVISWKIEGYQEDSYEEIASYQLYAYQETSAPPSTTLWKKIGDVKALPLPMACTLTQFMAGYKYYFAVRAVDIRSRFGPFSLPGSILLLNKM